MQKENDDLKSQVAVLLKKNAAYKKALKKKNKSMDKMIVNNAVLVKTMNNLSQKLEKANNKK
jgi:deoxyadenosine/deoxycytidine kinase